MVNKYNNYVRNTKKLMRKIGKKWVVVSAVLLGLLGGSAYIAQVNADSTTQNNTVQVSSNYRLSHYINTNNIINLANEAKSNKATNQYNDLLNMSHSSNIKGLINGEPIGTAKSNGTWLGNLKELNNDFNSITNNGHGTNTTLNNADHKLTSENSTANGISSVLGLFGKSSSTVETASNVANYAPNMSLPSFADTTNALTSIVSNSSASSDYDSIISDAANLTNKSNAEVNALNDMSYNLDKLDIFLTNQGNSNIGLKLGNEATKTSSVANTLSSQLSSSASASKAASAASASNSSNSITYITPASSNKSTKKNSRSKSSQTIKVVRDLVLHNNKHFTKDNASYAVSSGARFKVLKVVHDHKATRYVVKYGKHNYFITANPRYVKGHISFKAHKATLNYIYKSDFKRGHKMVVKSRKAICEYKGLKFGPRKATKYVKPNKKLYVKRVVNINNGKMTRLELTNHLYITSNKSFVSVI